MTSRAQHQAIKLQAEVDKFNSKFKVGDPVFVQMDNGSKKLTKVRHAAEVMSGHTAVAWFDDISGAYIVERVSEVKKEPEKITKENIGNPY